jgi:hypothetical protein
MPIRRVVVAGVLALAAGAAAGSQAAQLTPRPVAGAATYLCPRFIPEIGLELGGVSGEVYAQTYTKGAPQGMILYGQIRAASAAVDTACRRSRRVSAGRAAGLVNSLTQLPQSSNHADFDDLTCIVRNGGVLVRFAPVVSRGVRVGTRMDIGVVGRRDLIARITIGKREGTMRVSRFCT